MAVELPSGEVFVANDAAAALLGIGIDSLRRGRAVELERPDQRPGAEAALALVAEGTLTGYQAVREVDAGPHHGLKVVVWVSALNVGDERFALVSLGRIDRAGTQFEPAGDRGQQPGLGDIALGTIDGDWRVDRISSDVADLLGFEPGQVRGAPMLGAVHPADAPGLLVSIDHAWQTQRAVCMPVRLRNRAGGWTRVSAVLAPLSGADPPPLGFALIRPPIDAARGEAGNRTPALERHMVRIANELRAAGIISRLDRLPDRARMPELSQLTGREWEVLTRLLDGQRVPTIAHDLFLSPSTIRSRLSAVFSKLGVHSQSELLERLRRGT